MENPFIYPAPVPTESFIGRREQIQIVNECIKKSISWACYGINGIGRTSLLHYLNNFKEQDAENIFLYIDMKELKPLTENNFWQSVIRLLHKNFEYYGLQKDLIEDLDKKEINRFDIEKIIEYLGENKKKLVLLLEYLNLMYNTDDENILHTNLRALLTRPGYRLVIICSISQSLSELDRQMPQFNSPLENVIIEYRLPPFYREEIDEINDKILGNYPDYKLSRQILDFIHKISGGLPVLVNMASWLIFDFKKRIITRGLFEFTEDKFRSEFENLTRNYFESLWNSFTDEEKILLLSIAIRNLNLKGKKFNNKNLNSDIKIYGKNYFRLRRFEDLYLINRQESNIEFFSPMLQIFILRKIETDDIPKIENRSNIYRLFKVNELTNIYNYLQKNKDFIKKEVIKASIKLFFDVIKDSAFSIK